MVWYVNISIIPIMTVTAVFSLDSSPDFEKIAEAYGLDFHLEHNDGWNRELMNSLHATMQP